jgi:uncharacterized membrane protein
MTYVIAYVAVLIVFGTIDAVWLTTMGALLYRPALGDILAQSLRVVPAVAFYLSFRSASWCSPCCRDCARSRR